MLRTDIVKSVSTCACLLVCTDEWNITEGTQLVLTGREIYSEMQ